MPVTRPATALRKAPGISLAESVYAELKKALQSGRFEPGERLNVGQIADVSTLSRSAVSHHLKILREAGVLDSVKEGKEVYFWIDKTFLVDALDTVVDYIREKV